MISNGSDLRRVDLDLLVDLALLLEERSVRGAARRAGLTPSAMSHALARLRALFDDPLLVRAGRTLVPTPRAVALEVPLAAALDAVRALLEGGVPFDPSTSRRAFRLVATDHVATVLLPAVEARLARQAPGVDLHLMPLVPETMDQLRQGAVDAAVGIFPEAPPEARVRRLFDDAFVTVARRDHPRVGAGPLGLEAFLAEDHLLVAPRGTARGRVDEVLAHLGRSRRVSRTFPGFLEALLHAAEGDALLTISRRMVQALGDRLGLIAHEPPLPLERYTLSLLWHPRLDGSAEDAWFRGVLVDAAEGLAPLDAEAAGR